MSPACRDAVARVRVLLTVSVGAVLAVVVPGLVMSGADVPGTAVTVLSLALAALLALSMMVRLSPAGGTRPSRRPGRDGPPPVLSGRVTDRVHHPLRPRAPGLA